MAVNVTPQHRRMIDDDGAVFRNQGLEGLTLPDDQPPHLIVVVDTEAEFDWTALPDSQANSVNAIRNIHLVQEIFSAYGITPCYVVDYPMATQSESIDILGSIFEANPCEVGAHLHPWVNPPHVEELTRTNMFPGNLAGNVEARKLETLTSAIERAFAVRPHIYKAGRYGIGPNTAGVLRSCGYEVDLSVCPPFDYSADGGPDFSRSSCRPYWFGEDSSLLEIPLSGAFVGFAGQFSPGLHRLAGHFDFARLRGVLARLGIVDRLLLSPEGHTISEHRKLVEFLLHNGVRTFTWSFHSPSAFPGMTAYTRNNRELHQFLDSFRAFFDYFFNELQGVATTPTRLRQIFRQAR